MSDSAQGPGWWQASDGKWYPPEQAPAAAAPAPPPAYGPPPQPGAAPDGAPPGYGPPPQPMGAPMGYSAPPPQGMSGCLKAFLIVLGLSVVLGIVAVIVAATLVDDAVDNLAEDLVEGSADEQDDIDEVECGEDDFGNLFATVTVTNDSSERSNYIIEVNFVDGNVQLESAVAFINAVEPGQQAEGEASTATDAPGDFDCRAVGVQRFSDENDG